MKKHSIIAVLTATALCLTSLFIPLASALSQGDVDADGEITAADARLTLRAAVGLETLTADQISAVDTDNDSKITAADARQILRAAVRLEMLKENISSHVHEYDSWEKVDSNSHKGICKICGKEITEPHTFGEKIIIKKPTCTQTGKAVMECTKCGYRKNELLNNAHEFEITEEKPKTCTEEGYIKKTCKICGATVVETIPCSHNPGPAATCTEAQVCLDCGKILAPPLGHRIDISKLGIEKGVVCSVCGKTVVPSFNDLVNSLKTNAGKNTYSNFSKTVATFNEPKYEGIMKIMKLTFDKVFKDSIGSTTEYTPFVKNRFLKNENFIVLGENFVSALKESDAKSVKAEKISGVDFVKKLPASYTDTYGNTEDLTSLKNSSIGDVYKVSVAVKEELYSGGGPENISTAIDRIYLSDYKEMLEGIGEGMKFDEFNLGGFIDVDGGIVTNCSVTYYFDAKTLNPIAAEYFIKLSLKQNINSYFNETEDVVKDKTGTIAINVVNTINDYYFFNDYFDIK